MLVGGGTEEGCEGATEKWEAGGFVFVRLAVEDDRVDVDYEGVLAHG